MIFATASFNELYFVPDLKKHYFTCTHIFYIFERYREYVFTDITEERKAHDSDFYAKMAIPSSVLAAGWIPFVVVLVV